MSKRFNRKRIMIDVSLWKSDDWHALHHRFRSQNEMDWDTIAPEMNRVFWKTIINYLKVGKCIQMFVYAQKPTDNFIVSQSEIDFNFDNRITSVLSEELFLSVYQIVKKLMMSKSIMYCHLIQTKSNANAFLLWQTILSMTINQCSLFLNMLYRIWTWWFVMIYRS